MSDSDDGPTRPIKIRKFSKLTTGKKSLDESVDSDFEPPFRRPLKVPHSGKRIVELESSDECEVLEIIPVATNIPEPLNEPKPIEKLPPMKLIRKDVGTWQKLPTSDPPEPVKERKRLNPDLTPEMAAKLIPVQLSVGIYSGSKREGLVRWFFQDGSVVDMLNGKLHSVIEWKKSNPN